MASSNTLYYGTGTNHNPTYITTTTGTTSTWIQNPIITVQNMPAGLDVNGSIRHNGRDLEERLRTIEKVLQIPERDVKLEAKHPKLKELYDAYINALGKYRTFEAIKGTDDD